MKATSSFLDWWWGVRVSLLMLSATATLKADVVLDWNTSLGTVAQSDGAILSGDYTTALSGVADGPAKDASMALGASIAQQYLGWRASDGADQMVEYMPTALPGRWQPDPFNPKPAWGSEWSRVTPFTLTSSQQFAVPGVPDMSSQEYVEFDACHAKLTGEPNG